MKLALIPLPLLTVVALVACGDGRSTTVNVSLREWSVEPSVSQLQAAKVEFVVQNAGTLPHQFIVLSSDAAPGDLPLLAGKVDEDKVIKVAELEPMAPGQSQTVSVKLPAGKYLLICNLTSPGVADQPAVSHYRNEMVASLLVEK
jgi:uncharacterized cupredoxin-like copper-binding protein